MKHSRRRLRGAGFVVAIQLLAWASGPLGVPGVAWLLEGHHETSLTLEDGHVDLVLTHGGDDHARDGETEISTLAHHAEEHPSGHVVHLCSSDDALSAKRVSMADAAASEVLSHRWLVADTRDRDVAWRRPVSRLPSRSAALRDLSTIVLLA